MKIFKLILIFIFPFLLFSQEKNQYYFNGNINFNNNGIDWIPLFSRGKPTIISSLSFGKDRFSINPLIRYDLEGLQLWGIDVYWNYQIIRKEKIKFDLGLFLPGVFTTEVNVQEENLPNTILQPWSAGMVNPNFTFAFNQKYGLKVSYFNGFPIKIINYDQYKKIRLLFVTPYIEEFNISEKINFKWSPQFYTIKMDDSPTGLFSAQTLTLNHNDFPFSISSVMNKPIYFGGLTGKKFDWNIALNYSFDFNFIEKPKKINYR